MGMAISSRGALAAIAGWLGLSAGLLCLPAEAQTSDSRPAVVIATNELARGLEPGSDTGNVDVRVIYSIFDTLIRRDFANPLPGGGERLVPGLAESWKRIDARTLEVSLRKGVTFHNGDELTADDVMFTFSPERLWGANSAVVEGRGTFGHLEKVEKLDAHRVRFITKAPDLVLESRLATYTSWIVNARSWLQHREAAEKQNASLPKERQRPWLEVAIRNVKWAPVGTGPYKFRGWKNNEFIALDANDAYWGGRPAAKSITFREVPEPATRIAGLVSGEFHIITDVPPDQTPLLAKYPDLVLSQVPLENSHVLAFNMADPLLGDKRIRHALNLAIDRDVLNKALWDGKAYTPTSHQLPAFGKLFIPDRTTFRYDPDKARALLAEAGYKGQRIGYRIIANYYARGGEAAQILLEMWKKVGLNVELEFVENFQQVRAKGMQIYPWSNTFRLPDPAGGILISWGPKGQTVNSWKHFILPPGYEETAAALSGADTTEARQAAFAKLLDLFEDAMPMTMLYNPIAVFASRKNIEWSPYPIHYMDFRPDVFRIK